MMITLVGGNFSVSATKTNFIVRDQRLSYQELGYMEKSHSHAELTLLRVVNAKYIFSNFIFSQALI